MRALAGASKGTRAVETFRLSRARERSELMKAKVADEIKKQAKETYPEAAPSLRFLEPLFGARDDPLSPAEQPPGAAPRLV